MPGSLSVANKEPFDLNDCRPKQLQTFFALNDPKAPSPALYQSEGTIRRSIRKKVDQRIRRKCEIALIQPGVRIGGFGLGFPGGVQTWRPHPAFSYSVGPNGRAVVIAADGTISCPDKRDE
jgi:hypothetical protein